MNTPNALNTPQGPTCGRRVQGIMLYNLPVYGTVALTSVADSAISGLLLQTVLYCRGIRTSLGSEPPQKHHYL